MSRARDAADRVQFVQYLSGDLHAHLHYAHPMTIEFIAGTYGVLMSLAPLLQARRMRQQRSSADVSILYLAVLAVGFALYFAYGVSIGNRLLIVTNIVSIAATSATLVTAVVLRHS